MTDDNNKENNNNKRNLKDSDPAVEIDDVDFGFAERLKHNKSR